MIFGEIKKLQTLLRFSKNEATEGLVQHVGWQNGGGRTCAEHLYLYLSFKSRAEHRSYEFHHYANPLPLYAINSTTIMLEELRRITSTEPYKPYGGMRVKEILITPWDTPNAKFVF